MANGYGKTFNETNNNALTYSGGIARPPHIVHG